MVGYVRHGRSMHRAARRDELTGLHNRRAARECAEAMLARERGLAVILFDLDRFKHVNDSLGHHAGDHLLAVLGQRLAEVVRDPDDVVARLGGDEFVVLARGMHDDESVRVLCERVTRAVSAPVTVDGIEVSVGASIGIALAPEHGSDYGTLLQCADIAMYDAKGRRAGWQIYRDEFAGSDRAGLVLDADLRRAVVDGRARRSTTSRASRSSTGEMTGAEALVRWQHPDARPAACPASSCRSPRRPAPSRSSPAPCSTSSLDQVVAVARSRATTFPVAVNVSAHDVNDPRFADRRRRAARRPRPARLRAWSSSSPRPRCSPTRTRPRSVSGGSPSTGVRIAIDDFGAGYASLLYLRRFPVSVLKLDRSLVQGLTVDPTDAALVRWTIEMAHTLRVDLRRRGCRGRRDPRGAAGARLRRGAGLLPAGAGAGRRAGARPDARSGPSRRWRYAERRLDQSRQRPSWFSPEVGARYAGRGRGGTGRRRPA